MRPAALALALTLLAGFPLPAAARPRPDLRDPASRPVSGLAGLLRGPTLRPGGVIVTDEAGRQRTLELDDLAPLRLRLSIPF